MEWFIAIAIAAGMYALFDKLDAQTSELKLIRKLLEDQIHPPEY